MNKSVPTAQADRANNFDLLRLLFAVLVVCTHTRELSGFTSDFPLFYSSVWGIDGFFIISGFLIYESLTRHPGLAGYGIRRTARIFPAYAAVIIIQCAMMLALQAGTVPFGDILQYLAANLVFLNFLQPSIGDVFTGHAFNAVNGALWTLKVEVAFYVLLPIGMMIFRRYFLFIVVIGILLSIGVNTMLSAEGLHRLANQFPAKFYLFGAGILLAAYRQKIPQYAYIVAIVAAGALLLTVPLPRHVWLLAEMICLGAGILFIAHIVPSVRLRWDLSYTVYLAHFPIIQFSLFHGVQNAMTLTVFLAYVLVCTFVIAFVLTILIERPALAYGRKISEKYVP